MRQAGLLFTKPLIRDNLPFMAENKFRCAQCDKEESRCDCDKYCINCQGFHKTRLVADGMYYCEDCRQACGYKAEDE